MFIDIGCIEQDCRDVTQTCEKDVTCEAIFETYFMACEQVINGSYDNANLECPSGCADALQAFITQVAPGYSTPSFCSCNDNVICENAKSNLIKYNCISQNCESAFESCMEDVTCAPIGQNYYDKCESIIEGSYTGNTCPTDCANALTSYIDEVYGYDASKAITDYCDCDDISSCETVRQQLVTSQCYVQSTTTSSTSSTTLVPSSSSLSLTCMNSLIMVMIGIIFVLFSTY
jgi:hypothetical protein